MIDKSHIQRFHASTTLVPNSKRISKLRDDFYACLPMLKYFVDRYNIQSPEVLEEYVFSYVSAIFSDIASTKFLDSHLYEIQTIEYLLKNPKIIAQEYPKVKDKEDNHIMYDANLARSQKLVIVHALHELQVIEDFAKEVGVTKSTKLNNILIKTDNVADVRKMLKVGIELLNQKNIYDKIQVMLKYQLTLSKEFVKDEEIKSITSIKDFLLSLGLLGPYLDSYNYNSKKLGFEDLDYEFSSSDNSIGLVDSLSKEYLETLSIEELTFLNAFWCNRFAKECQIMNLGLMVTKDLDLWQDIINGQTDFSISNQELAAIFKKNFFISRLLSDTFHLHQNKISEAEAKGQDAKNLFTADYSSYYSQLDNRIGSEYKKYFSSTLVNSNNNFMEDVNFLLPISNLQSFAYHKKQTYLEPIIKSWITKPHSNNWGFVRKEIKDDEEFDSIESKSPVSLLAFDVEGFNLPFRFHVEKESLLDLLRVVSGNSIIPEYQGHEDFVFNVDGKNAVIPGNIIMPILKKHKPIIKSKANSNEDIENKNFWEHLYYLSTGSFPKHLTTTVQKGKKQPLMQQRLPIVYSDLKTGKRYYKDKTGYIEMEDSNVR
jgi:hypothetical protein